MTKLKNTSTNGIVTVHMITSTESIWLQTGNDIFLYKLPTQYTTNEKI